MLTGHLQHTAAASSLQGTGKGGSLGGRVTPFCLQLAAAWLASPLQLQQPEDSEKTGRRKQLDQCYRWWFILYGVHHFLGGTWEEGMEMR